jgi:catechol-2,3-dioxygenase
MTARIGNIHLRLCRCTQNGGFWSEALGRPLDAGSSPVFASIGGDAPDRAEPAWYREGPEPKTAKNRMHVDLVDPNPSAVDQ